MALELWRPRSAMARRREPLEDVFGRFFDDWLAPRTGGEARGWAPAVDMIDRKDEILVHADLPGLTEKDIEVHVENGVLSIRGQRQSERDDEPDISGHLGNQ